MGLNTTVTEEEFLQQIQEYEKEFSAYELDSQRKEFAFDHMFSKHQSEKQTAGIDQSSEEGSEEEAESDGGQEEAESDDGQEEAELEDDMNDLSLANEDTAPQIETSDT